MDDLVRMMLFVAAAVAVVVIVIVVLTRKGPVSLNKDEYRAKWLRIEQSITKEESTQHLAIMNADKLLDHALKARGMKGNTMGERMKNGKDVFSNRNAIWTAHKLRNRIAHEPEVRVSLEQTRQAMRAFKAALRDVGAL